MRALGAHLAPPLDREERSTMARRQRGQGDEADPKRGAPPDPEPWVGRRPPSERPRHERAQPEDPDDPAETAAAIAAESWGETVELRGDESVDGDFNGAPELEALTEDPEGVDLLDAMEGREVEALRESTVAEEVLADAVADRRQVLLERLDEARELGLGEVFEAALAATERAAATTPMVPDDDVLQQQLAQIDAALEQLELRSAG
jgi:hypothetical protein